MVLGYPLGPNSNRRAEVSLTAFMLCKLERIHDALPSSPGEAEVSRSAPFQLDEPSC